jgi:uncharacterized protein YeaO (DUF488 family)
LARHRLALKRVYAAAEPGDGRHVLVERLWPRGLSKEKAAVDLWLKEVAPSEGLRRWFHAGDEAHNSAAVLKGALEAKAG